MRRIISVFLIISLVLLSSCAPSSEETENITERLSAIDGFSADMIVTAEFSDRTAAFRLETTVSGDISTVKVTEPAELEGINIAIEPGGCVISYDGASFEAGDPGSLPISPVTVAAEIARLWRSASPMETGSEKRGDTDCVLLVYASGSDETRIWIDEMTLSPIAAEFLRDGERTILCEFVSFTIGGS